MSKDVVSRSLSVHKEHEVLLKLEAAGLTDELAQKVIGSKDNDLATKVVRLIQNGGFEATSSQKRAREIMGNNFFGVEENFKHFGIYYAMGPDARKALSEVPFTEEVLQAHKDTHVLVATFPLSILDIRSKAPRSLFYRHEDAWCNSQRFAKDKGEVAWHLVRKTPVQNSTNRTWSDQQSLLSQDEETPTARVLTYTIIGHFLATGERLFEHIYVRTSSVVSDDDGGSVGYFGSGGLRVDSRWDDGRSGDLGVSSSRKSN